MTAEACRANCKPVPDNRSGFFSRRQYAPASFLDATLVPMRVRLPLGPTDVRGSQKNCGGPDGYSTDPLLNRPASIHAWRASPSSNGRNGSVTLVFITIRLIIALSSRRCRFAANSCIQNE